MRKWNLLLALMIAANSAPIAAADAQQPVAATLQRANNVQLMTAAEHECAIAPIACNTTVAGSINGFECDLGGGTYTDFWRFPGTAGQRVVIDASSGNMDTAVVLLDAVPNVRANDDDSGPGTDSHLEFNLDRTENWAIAVANALPFDLGNYTLSLACGATTSCVSSPTAMCLNNNRFKVEATFQVPGEPVANGRVQKLTADTGYFWFFNADNVEVVVKVLNGCPLNSRYWVFTAGLTNVQVDLKVTDTETGAVKTYTNPQGTKYVAVQDTAAFATCP